MLWWSSKGKWIWYNFKEKVLRDTYPIQAQNDSNSIVTNVLIAGLVNDCINGQNGTTFNDLSEYDKFVFGSILVSQEGNISTGALEEGFANYQYLELFCHNGNKCDARAIDDYLANLASQMTFLLERFLLNFSGFQGWKILHKTYSCRIVLPEEDFGKIFSSAVYWEKSSVILSHNITEVSFNWQNDHTT